MLVDGGIDARLDRAAASAVALEATGYDGGRTEETAYDPLVALAVAAEHTDRLQLGTAIIVAFARSPMTMAITANEIQRFSEGRLSLGLGSQVKPHIERRYSMPWSRPAARMREYILALRAIWTAWEDGSQLDFRGEFYTHTLMTPTFSPEPHSFGQPLVFLAAVGERMTEVAGEVADGIILHPFTTPRYVREVSLPTFEKSLATAGRTRADIQVSAPVFVVTGRDKAEMDASASRARRQLAFYGSTPAYRGVLELHGWGEAADRLHAMSRRGEWDEMGDVITDDMLDLFALVGAPDTIADRLLERYGDVLDRTSFVGSVRSDVELAASIVADIRAASTV